jgi:hypothetical protein
MPGPEYLDANNSDDGDDQERAEALDEDNTDDREEVNEMRTFEEMPDVYDVTQRTGDRDDDEGLALDSGDFTDEVAEAMGDELLEEDDELDYRAEADDEEEDEIRALDGGFDEDQLDDEEIEGLDEDVQDADTVTGGGDPFTKFQSKGLNDDDLKQLGYAEDRNGETRAAPDVDED